MGLLAYIATLLGTTGHVTYFNVGPHFSGAMGSQTTPMHCQRGGQQRVVALLHYIAALLGSCGQWKYFSAAPH